MAKLPAKFTELVRFDWFMKYLFRDKSTFDVLEGFLSVLLKEQITILEILESEGNQSSKKDKFNRVDVMVKTAKEERIIVEIQNNEEYDYLQRILYGACKVITENMKKGEPYATVKKVISVSIVYFETGQGNDYIYHGSTRFRGIHSNEELLLNKEQQTAFNKENPYQIYPEFYLIQAFSFKDIVQNDLDEWVYLFKNNKVEVDFKAQGIDQAKTKLAIAKLNKSKKAEYNRFLNELHDEASWNETQRIKQQYQEKLVKEATEKATEEAEKKAALALKESEKKAALALKESEKKAALALKEALKESEKKATEALKESEKKAVETQQKALKEGKIEIAQNLKKIGIPVKDIIAATGLSAEEIEKL